MDKYINHFKTAVESISAECDLTERAKTKLKKNSKKESISVSSGRTIKKSFARYIVAVSAVLVISGLTVTADVMHSREDALTGLEGSEYIDFLAKNDIDVSCISENSHMRVYLDSVVSDGKICRINYCCEALDKKCRKYFDEVNINNDGLLNILWLSYSDNYDLVSAFVHSDDDGVYKNPLNDENHLYFSYLVSLENVDLTRPVSVIFASEVKYISKPNDPKNLFNSIELPVDLRSNVSSIIISDENGLEMNMSPLGIHFKETDDFTLVKGTNEINLYYADGSEMTINEIGVLRHSDSEGASGMIYTNHKLINTENLVKARINGKIFFVK